jgi:4-hydroxy-tetrahydrodipicolinate reductase
MRIALIGYGRMGQEIEKIALSRGHSIALKIDVDNSSELTVENLKGIDVAIEFTLPTTAVHNYLICFEAGVPVVSGTTGWLDRWDEIVDQCTRQNAAFFYASNFSLGANLFFELNKKLARLMQPFDQYRVSLTEVHHTKKLDAPSGTGISLAEDILKVNNSLKGWVDYETSDPLLIPVHSIREGDIPGIHTIKYDSEVDYIEITHSAKNRKGLALGATIAAEFIAGKKGVMGMSDLLLTK